MDDSARKTSSVFLMCGVSLIILRMGFVVECSRAEIMKRLAMPLISQNKACARFLCFCWLVFSCVFCCQMQFWASCFEDIK